MKGDLEDITACSLVVLYFNNLIWGTFEGGMGAVKTVQAALHQPWGIVTCLL